MEPSEPEPNVDAPLTPENGPMDFDMDQLKEALLDELDSGLVSRNQELEEENEQLANELEVIKEALENYMDTERVGTQNQELQKENDKLTAELEKYQETIKTLTKEALEREQAEGRLRQMFDQLKQDFSLKAEAAEVLEKHLHTKTEESESLMKQVRYQKAEIQRWSETSSKLREQLATQQEKLQAQITDTKRRERNKTRALSSQIDAEKTRASAVTMQAIDQQRQIRELTEENQNLKQKLSRFEKHKQFQDDREIILKKEVERLLKENENLENFQIESLDQMTSRFDEALEKQENQPLVVLADDSEKKEDQALDALAEQMRLRSMSDVSDKSDGAASKHESPRPAPIPAPSQQPQAPSAELVYTRLCAMAVALKFSHLGHYNSELLKLSKVCIKNNIWKWYEVYDELVKYMENIEETITGSWEEEQQIQQQPNNFIRRLFWAGDRKYG